MATGDGWVGRIVEVGPGIDAVWSWAADVAEAQDSDGAGEWFWVELDPGRIELGVRGTGPAPVSLTPALFPGEIVPASYVASLVAGSVAVVRAARTGVVPDPEVHLRVFYEELVDPAEQHPAMRAAAAWLTRVADAAGDQSPIIMSRVGEADDRSADELRRALATLRAGLDEEVGTIAALTAVSPLAIRSQIVARAAHAHLTRVLGSGPKVLRAEASLLRSLAG